MFDICNSKFRSLGPLRPEQLTPSESFQHRKPVASQYIKSDLTKVLAGGFRYKFGSNKVVLFVNAMVASETETKFYIKKTDFEFSKTEEDRRKVVEAIESYHWSEHFSLSSISGKVEDHHRLSGHDRGAAHTTCKLLINYLSSIRSISHFEWTWYSPFLQSYSKKTIELNLM